MAMFYIDEVLSLDLNRASKNMQIYLACYNLIQKDLETMLGFSKSSVSKNIKGSDISKSFIEVFSEVTNIKVELIIDAEPIVFYYFLCLKRREEYKQEHNIDSGPLYDEKILNYYKFEEKYENQKLIKFVYNDEKDPVEVFETSKRINIKEEKISIVDDYIDEVKVIDLTTLQNDKEVINPNVTIKVLDLFVENSNITILSFIIVMIASIILAFRFNYLESILFAPIGGFIGSIVIIKFGKNYVTLPNNDVEYELKEVMKKPTNIWINNIIIIVLSIFLAISALSSLFSNDLTLNQNLNMNQFILLIAVVLFLITLIILSIFSTPLKVPTKMTNRFLKVDSTKFLAFIISIIFLMFTLYFFLIKFFTFTAVLITFVLSFIHFNNYVAMKKYINKYQLVKLVDGKKIICKINLDTENGTKLIRKSF